MTTGAGLEITAAVPDAIIAKNAGATPRGANTAPNPASSWKAVLASAGISVKVTENDEHDQDGASAGDTPVKSTPMTRGSAKATGSPQSQLFAASRAKSETKRSGELVGAGGTDRALTHVSVLPESDAILRDRKAPLKSGSVDDAQAARALRVNQRENLGSAGRPEPETILEPASAALPAIVSAPVFTPPLTELPVKSSHDAFVASLSTSVQGDASASAIPHGAPSDGGSIGPGESAAGKGQVPIAVKSESSSTPPINPVHPGAAHLPPADLDPAHTGSVPPTHPDPDLTSANNQPSSTSLQSARGLAATQQFFSSDPAASEPSKFSRQIAMVLSGDTKASDAKWAAGKQASLDTAAGLAIPMESREASSGGTAARQTGPSGLRNNAPPAAAIETAHAASRPGLSMAESSILLPVRESVGVQTSSSTKESGISATGSKTASDMSDIRDTFVSLDGARSAPAPTWIHAGARMAEAGYQDPALGWVAVRAQVDISGVHASVVPTSADAAQALGGHLASLNAYLTENHSPVETLTMAVPESHSHEQSFNQRGGQDAGEGAGQGSGMSGNAGQPADSQRERIPAAATAVRPIVAAAGEERVVGPPAGGVHISVMA